jgi:hypothetical protein
MPRAWAVPQPGLYRARYVGGDGHVVARVAALMRLPSCEPNPVPGFCLYSQAPVRLPLDVDDWHVRSWLLRSSATWLTDSGWESRV